jgi:hypothetical protein
MRSHAQVDYSGMPRKRSAALIEAAVDEPAEPAKLSRLAKCSKHKAPAQVQVQVQEPSHEQEREHENDLFAAIFSSIYRTASTTRHPRIDFCINGRKLEEAKKVFADAIASGTVRNACRSP